MKFLYDLVIAVILIFFVIYVFYNYVYIPHAKSTGSYSRYLENKKMQLKKKTNEVRNTKELIRIEKRMAKLDCKLEELNKK